MAATLVGRLLLLLQVGHHILITTVDAFDLPPPLKITTSFQRTLEMYNFTFSRSKPITVERAWDFLYRNWLTLKALKEQQSTAFPAEDVDGLFEQLNVYYRMTLDPTNPHVPANILFSLSLEETVNDRFLEGLPKMRQQLRTLGGPYHFRHHNTFDYVYGRYRLYYALLQRHFRLHRGFTRISLKMKQSLRLLGNRLKVYSDYYNLTSEHPLEANATRKQRRSLGFSRVRNWANRLWRPEFETIPEDREPETDDDDDEATLGELPGNSSRSYNLPPKNAEKEEDMKTQRDSPREDEELPAVTADTDKAATEVSEKEVPPAVTPEAAPQFPAVKSSPSSIIELPRLTPPEKSNPAVSQPKKAHNRLVQLLKNPYFLTVGAVVAVSAVWHLMDHGKDGGVTFKSVKYHHHPTFTSQSGGSGIGWILLITILVLLSGGVAVWLYYRKQRKTQSGSSKGEEDSATTDSPSSTTSSMSLSIFSGINSMDGSEKELPGKSRKCGQVKPSP